MDAANKFIYDEEMLVCEHVLAEVEKQSNANAVAMSSHYLYLRMLNGVRTLYVLSKHAQHDWAVDGGSILRTIHDAMLQLLWLLHDPARREHWAAMYLAYIHIDKFRALSGIDASGTDYAIDLADSVLRPEIEETVRQDLLSFGPHFLTKEGRQQHEQRGDSYLCDPRAKYRRHWYPDSLRRLAEVVGCAGEHTILHHDTSAGVHASLWALHRDPIVKAESVLQVGLRFCLRAAGAVAEALGIHLANDQVEKTGRAKANLFDRPKPHPPEVDP